MPNKVLTEDNPRFPQSLEAIIARLDNVIYPLEGFRSCADLRTLDRYQGARDVVDMLKSWQQALQSQTD